jgi:hypothetical protein
LSAGHLVLCILAAVGLAVGVRLAWHTTLGQRRAAVSTLSGIGLWILEFIAHVLLNLILNLIITAIINIIVNLFLELITLGQADPVFVGGDGLFGGGGASGSW